MICKCGALIPNGYTICTECKGTNYVVLDEVDTEWNFDDEAFVVFLDEGE